jgi:hypothetical protein
MRRVQHGDRNRSERQNGHKGQHVGSETGRSTPEGVGPVIAGRPSPCLRRGCSAIGDRRVLRLDAMTSNAYPPPHGSPQAPEPGFSVLSHLSTVPCGLVRARPAFSILCVFAQFTLESAAAWPSKSIRTRGEGSSPAATCVPNDPRLRAQGLRHSLAWASRP